MKTLNSVFFLCFIFFLFSCTNELEVIEMQLEDELNTINEFIILQENAIANLEDLLLVVDTEEDAVSRSLGQGKLRRIKNIETLNNQMENTRSSANDVNPLFYLVNFEDDQGYAILAADKRISSPVLALVETGSISPDDFANGEYEPYDSSIDYGYEELENFNLYDEEEDDYYAAAALPINEILMQFAQQEVLDAGGGGGGGSSSTTVKEVTGSWVINKKISPLLTTLWSQKSPFNDACPKRRWHPFQSYKRAPAGCVPIAVAQIMAFHEYPQVLTCNGVRINWKTVKNIWSISNYNSSGIDSENNQLSQFVAAVGSWCDALYTKSWTFALPRKARDCMQKFGYSNVVRHKSYNDSRVYDMLDNGKPLFTASLSKSLSGHAWVIDGYIDRSRTNKKINSNTGAVISSNTENQFLVHCNWGWKGGCNGYYISKVFNTKKGPVERESGIDLSNPGKGSTNYNWLFYTITYKHPITNK